MSLHVFHVVDANEYWIATDAADVKAQRAEMMGAEAIDEDVKELNDSRVLGFLEEGEPESTREMHTCAEWVAKEGRGLLAACEP